MLKSEFQKIFEDRFLVIATKHKKESVIAPIFTDEFGVNHLQIRNFEAAALNYLYEPTVTILIKVTDSEGLSFSREYTIEVTNEAGDTTAVLDLNFDRSNVIL